MIGLLLFFIGSMTFAAVQHGSVFPITTTVSSYTISDNAYDASDLSSGVHFSFTAPRDGAFSITVSENSGGDFYFRKHTDNTFSSYTNLDNFYGSSDSYSYTFSATNGQAFYFSVVEYISNNSSVNKSFTIVYSDLPSITLTSASAQCSTDVKAQALASSSYYTFNGYAKDGYRPNGWKVISGTPSIYDSTAASIKVSATADVTLQLQCTTASLIEITGTQTYYTPQNDFYIASNREMRFHYKATSTDAVAIRANPKSYFNGTFYYYGNDNTFTTREDYKSLYSDSATFYIKPTSVGQEFYFAISPYSSSYYSYSISIQALSAAIVSIEGKTTPDTVAIGDVMPISTATIDTGYTFISWKLSSGTGTIADTSKQKTTFKPSSKTASLTINKKKGSIYKLNDKYQGFTFDKNGSSVANDRYGVRTYFEAPVTGTFAFISTTKNSYTLRVYKNDSSFSGISSYYNCSSNGYCKYTFNADKGSKYYFLLQQEYDNYVKDSIYAKVVQTKIVSSDTSGNGYVYVGSSNTRSDSSYTAGDTLPIRAYTGNAKFDHWEITSGTCSIIDSTSASTYLTITTDCQIKAVFSKPTMNAITKTEKKYTTGSDYSSGTSYSEGIRFYFTSKSSGSYVFTFQNKNNDYFYVYKFSNGDFGSYTNYNTSYNTYSDTVTVNAGDTVFYRINCNYASDTITAIYSEIQSYSVKLTSASKHCLVPKDSFIVFSNSVQKVTGSSESGYRPNGWKITSGKKNIIDSTTATISLKITSDVTLQLQCAKANLITIDDTMRTYSARNDFYEIDSSSYLRFRYTAPTSNPYIITIDASNYDGYFYDYSDDSTFTTYNNKTSIYKSTYKNEITPSATGENRYFMIVPDGNPYYGNDVGIRASKILYVKPDSSSTYSKVAAGDSLALYARIPNGKSFMYWKKVSGKGSFTDSTSYSTYYKPISDSSVLKPFTKESPIYKLTNKWTTYSFKNNASQTHYEYAIRTSYKATDTTTYVLQAKTATSFNIRYFYDSSFTTYITYNSSLDSSRRISLTPKTKDSTYYLSFYPYSNALNNTDSIKIRVVPVAKITFDTSSYGTGSVSSYYNSNATTLIAGDSIAISATSYNGYRFKHWSVASGSCTLADSTSSKTNVQVKGNCRFTPVFVPGILYKITATPTQYTTAEHYHSISPEYGVRFKFVAPSGGDYRIVVTRVEDGQLRYTRYTNSNFSTTSGSGAYFNPTYSEKITLAKGDSAFILINNYSYLDSLKPFWISYTTKESELVITADSNGTVSPRGYSPIGNNAKYGITAMGDYDYRFASWTIVSGSPTIDDLNAPRTLISVKGDAEIKALFRKGAIFKINKKAKTFNYQTHYYSERSYYDVRMTWTPPDSETYVIQFDSVDSLAAIFSDFGADSTFYSYYATTTKFTGAKSFLVKGLPKKPLYWSLRDISESAANKSFSVKIGYPYTLIVNPVAQGGLSVSGNISMLPYADTTISARPYGGYVFDKWVIDSGNVNIEDIKKSTTKFTVTDSVCIVHPTYVLDLTVQPNLEITGMDLTNHPAVCAQVNVTDANTGRTIVGMDSSNFVLYQDNTALPVQATTLQAISGASVALVIDESGSMSGTPILEAKKAVKQFIDEMGPYDRTAIIGFDGSIIIRQTMTSDKQLLYDAADKIAATGGTNINDGAYAGLQQLASETNPTTVIIFSDGYGSGSKSNSEVINYANQQNTTIYSIAIGGSGEDPLKYIAEGTGGTFSVAPSADALSSIYANIQASVQSRYVLCYESPDQVLDNDKHEVIIKTNFNGKNSSDTTYWREDFMPPKITLTKATQSMIGVSQDAGDSIVIEAYISSKTSVESATLYLRQAGIPSKSFQSVEMENVKDSLWRFVIPAIEVESPGYDFYITAQESSGLIGKTPAIPAPSREPYTIPVDNDVPTVKIVDNNCIDTTSGYGKISFTITDTNGIYKSYIYYKDSLDILYYEKEMSRKSSDEKTWIAKIPAKHFANGSAEYYIRAIDSTGTAVRWPKNRSKYLYACETEVPEDTIPVDTVKKDTIVPKDSIKLVNAESSSAKISRATESVKIKLWTNTSEKKDTISASLRCLRSGDTETGIKLIYKKDGWFENIKPTPKDEYPAMRNNGVISCEALDTIVAEYRNPKSKKYIRDTVAIDGFVALSYQFLKVKQDEDLDSVKTSSKANYRLRVTTTSPKMNKIDTIAVKLFTNKGDTIQGKAVETSETSAIFDYIGDFVFVEDEMSMKDDQLDAVFNFAKEKNRIVIRAQIDKDSSKLSDRDSLIVYSTYVGADSAEIYDRDLDGKADFVRIHFKKPLKNVIESIDSVFWNKGTGEYRKVKKKDIKLASDSSWIEAKLEKDFKYGVTAEASKENAPYIKFQKADSSITQKVVLTDKIGAVPVKAVKHPGEVNLDDYLTPNLVIPPDTLVITLSEKIKRTGKDKAWQHLFRVSSSCKEDTTSKAIKLAEVPTVDTTGLVWTLVLGDFSILVGNCITTNPSAEYTDNKSNPLGRGGVNIEGNDGTLYLYDISPNPSVSGIGKTPKWLPAKAKKFVDVPDTLSTITIYSIAPYKASIYIYDNAGQFVSHFTQKFGYNGEMEDPLRGNDSKREKLGYLYWNQRTDKDRKVGTGIYIWKIFFSFDDGHSEIRTLKTGIKRNSNN